MSDAEYDRVLIKYPKAIAHLRRQLEDRRLGFILGAGVSTPYSFPDWSKLVERVAMDPEVNAGSDYADSAFLPLPILTEVLYQRFRELNYEQCRIVSSSIGDVERLLLAKWRRVLHRALYAGTPTNDEELLKVDSAYKHFLGSIRQSSLTVTYNFDDVLERLLLQSRTSDQKRTSQTFQTIVDPRPPFRRGLAIILHPNGYLPYNLMEVPSGTVVFSEGSFADQLIDVMAGQYSTLLHYLTKHTFLLIGLSLSDESLRHMLRQAARLSPGGYHYYIRFVPAGSEISEAAKRAEVASNFETYNLVTLHLSSSEINALGDILGDDVDDLRARAEELGVNLQYTYYLAGVPGAGKTTTFSHFNSFVTHDEWLEPRLALMSKPFTELTKEQETQVDEWVLNQIGLKNRKMLDIATKGSPGIHLIDRCPPDAISFTNPADWSSKAKQVRAAISPRQSKRQLHDGHVILLAAQPEEVVVRAALCGKETSVPYTMERHEDLQMLYLGSGTTELEVQRMSPTDVVKEVARLVYFSEYTTAELDRRLKEVEDGTRQSPARRQQSESAPADHPPT
ncbi:SIR2 family protein [uncultured Friedmanniella sp.]|uniref:SIR2 family protein n=1 Tax=uncultured Friedmanniella sp. TaxID=335381 RepID=UPI0035CB4509